MKMNMMKNWYPHTKKMNMVKNWYPHTKRKPIQVKACLQVLGGFQTFFYAGVWA